MKALLLLPVLLPAFLSFGGRAEVAAPLGEHDWAVDTGHSSVVFRIKHANAAWFQGTFDTITGTVTLDPAKPESGRVELVIPVESIDTNDKKRDDHLKAADFFSAKENPEITFKSTKIQARADGKLDVTGELSLAGKTQPLTIVVEKTGEGEFYGRRVGWMTTFSIQRSKFGMTYGLDKNVLGDEVGLSIALECVKPQ